MLMSTKHKGVPITFYSLKTKLTDVTTDYKTEQSFNGKVASSKRKLTVVKF